MSQPDLRIYHFVTPDLVINYLISFRCKTPAFVFRRRNYAQNMFKRNTINSIEKDLKIIMRNAVSLSPFVNHI